MALDLILCNKQMDGTLNMKIKNATPEETAMLRALEGKQIDVHESGRIITLDEQASEKFAALFSGIDEVMGRFRSRVMESFRVEPELIGDNKHLFEGGHDESRNQ